MGNQPPFFYDGVYVFAVLDVVVNLAIITFKRINVARWKLLRYVLRVGCPQ